MGRHSAPGDEEPEGSGLAVTEADAESAERRGRHARSEDTADTGPVPGLPMRTAGERAAVQDDLPTERLTLDEIAGGLLEPELEPEPGAEPDAGSAAEPAAGPVGAAEQGGAAEPAPPAATPASPKAAKGGSSTAADLALLRRHPAVRNRVLGAVLVPFVLYAALLLAVGAKGVTYLLWIWIPLVSAGVLAGLLLDRAHKQHAAGG